MHNHPSETPDISFNTDIADVLMASAFKLKMARSSHHLLPPPRPLFSDRIIMIRHAQEIHLIPSTTYRKPLAGSPPLVSASHPLLQLQQSLVTSLKCISSAPPPILNNWITSTLGLHTTHNACTLP
eukprot:scpid107989/ scgid21809/ 